jgi:hypothetical protein
MTRFLTSLNVASSVFDAHFVSEFELTGKFSVADRYTFLSPALMVFILGAELFSVDAYISKKVRTAQ